jgi:hypothetical protein
MTKSEPSPRSRTDTVRLSRTRTNHAMGPKEFREWFRTIRFFERERGWYFLSPDRLAVGPYVTERIAETQAVRLARILKNLSNQQAARVAVIEFALDGAAA